HPTMHPAWSLAREMKGKGENLARDLLEADRRAQSQAYEQRLYQRQLEFWRQHRHFSDRDTARIKCRLVKIVDRRLAVENQHRHLCAALPKSASGVDEL